MTPRRGQPPHPASREHGTLGAESERGTSPAPSTNPAQSLTQGVNEEKDDAQPRRVQRVSAATRDTHVPGVSTAAARRLQPAVQLALRRGSGATAASQPHRDVRRPTPTEGSRVRPRTSPGHRPAPSPGPGAPSLAAICGAAALPPKAQVCFSGERASCPRRPGPAAEALGRGFRQEAQATPGQGQQGGAPSHLAATLLHAQEARQGHPGGGEAWQLWYPQLTQAPEPLHWEGPPGPRGLRS